MSPPEVPHAHPTPAPLACLQCRRTHLKCGAETPTCTRCLSRNLVCTYTKSRRGYRTVKKRRVNEEDTLNHQTSSRDASHWSPEHVPDDQTRLPDTPPTIYTFPDQCPPYDSGQLPPPWADDDQLVNLYYLNFHAGHPILVPRDLYKQRNYPRALKAVVEFIGAQFTPSSPSHAQYETIEKELDNGVQNIPETVQARILYAISLVAQNEMERGEKVLAHAIDIALKLGMHMRDFAASHAPNRPLEQESLRRTWYELYVTDGCIAAFRRNTSFRTDSVSATALLPCEDSVYDENMSAFISPSKEDYERSLFSNQDISFSSFCYRIEAVRLLGRVLTITKADGVHRDQVQSVDNALAAFLHHLPPSKTEPHIINTYGELDELLLQTHVIIQYATILLHFPRSDLVASIPTVPATSVVPGGNATKFPCPCSRQNVHSFKTVDASKILSMLAAFRAPVHRHSPIIIYPLALAAIVQLSVSAIHGRSSSPCLEQHYDRVKLILGVLKSMGRYWSTAGVVLRALNKTALAVFQPSQDVCQNTAPRNDVISTNNMDIGLYTPDSGGVPWGEPTELQDLQGFFGLDFDSFCQ